MAHQHTAIDAAVSAGVRHIVYLSFLRASPTSTFTFARDHAKTEAHINGHDVAHTFLRDSLYLDLLPQIRRFGRGCPRPGRVRTVRPGGT